MGMKHRIRHGLELPMARKVIEKAMEGYAARFPDYHPRFVWRSDTVGELSFKAKGLSVAGDLEIIGPEVTVDIEVPFIFRVFKGKALKVIESEVNTWVAKANGGELD